MVSIINVLSGKSEEAAILALLNRLDQQKVTLRVEIENTLIRFNTMLIVRAGSVVLARPSALRDNLERGGMVRVKIPGEDEKELRLEISMPQYNLTNGTPVFLCKIPVKFHKTSYTRTVDRFNTTRFTNLGLVIPVKAWAFRVLDISQTGCKVLSKSGVPQTEFPIGMSFENTYFKLGTRVKIELARLIPRSIRGHAVGFEFNVRQEGLHQKYLDHLISSLDKKDKEAMKAERLD